MSKYDCPRACPKNPFGETDYDALLKIEGVVDGATMKRVVAHLGPVRVESILQNLDSRSGGDSDLAMASIETFVTRAAFYDRDDEGMTVAERWRDAGWKGLNNDSRVYMEISARPAPALLEVCEVLDDYHILVTDILDPQGDTVTVRDRNFASQASQYDVLFGWTRRLPDELRLRGNAKMVRRGRVFEAFLEEVEEMVRAGGEAALAERYLDLFERLGVLVDEEYSEMKQNMDPSWCRTFYRTNAAAQKVLRWFERASEFDHAYDEPDEPELQGALARFDWMRRGRWLDAPVSALYSNRIAPDGTVEEALGMVSFYGDSLMLENAGRERHTYLRGQLEGQLGDRIVFDREVVQAYEPGGGERGSGASPVAEGSGLTPAQESEALGAFLLNYHKKLLDDAIPALGGRTPREISASKDAADQRVLLEWAKSFANSFDRKRREGQPIPDMTWFFRELGLEELCSGS